MPPVSKNMVPRPSLPMGVAGVGLYEATLVTQSTDPQCTASQLAANVPLESPKVLEIVKERQEDASVGPEEVKEKGTIEKEL